MLVHLLEDDKWKILIGELIFPIFWKMKSHQGTGTFLEQKIIETSCVKSHPQFVKETNTD